MRLPCIALHAKIKMNLDTFLSLELLLGNIRNQGTALVILFGEFNARPKNRWVQNIRKNEGTQIDFISSLYVFSQLISEPTCNLQNSSCYIDLMFINQSNLVIKSGVQRSLQENCHHFFSKLNLQVMYRPTYKRFVQFYKNANTSSIQKALGMIDWNELFSSASVEKQVNILNDPFFQYFF